MMNKIYALIASFILSAGQVKANEKVSVLSPDAKVKVELTSSGNGQVFYQVSYDGKELLQASPLGLKADIGDFSNGLRIAEHKQDSVRESYKLERIKASRVDYNANRLLVSLSNVKNEVIQVEFRVSNNDIAFRYLLPKQGEPASVRVENETTGFRFPEGTTTFLTPQSDAMIGWKRSKPSYEEVYKTDAPMKENMEICSRYARLHEQMGDYILECARNSAQTGEPIVRNMEYAYPHQGFEEYKDQFMLGSRFLVAPMVKKGTVREVWLPKGIWRDDQGKKIRDPKSLTIEVPLNRLPYYERIK